MIKTRADLRYYIAEDKKANGIPETFKGWLQWRFNPRLRCINDLRYLEFYTNQGGVLTFLKYFYYYRFKRLCYKLNYTIYVNNFGPGLFIGHYGTLVVNKYSRIGKNCCVHVCVNIGGGGSTPGVPMIGDNVYIGPGVKIYGGITIGNNVSIGANAVVNKSFPDNVVIAGVPARIVRYK